MPVTILGDAGVQIAPGDAGALFDTSARFQTVGGQLGLHGSTISLTAVSLTPVWQGGASIAYQQLSSISALHFQTAANQILGVSGTLSEYATELERSQGEGRLALQQAEQWLTEIETQQTKLTQAQNAVAAAQRAITAAQGEIVVAGLAGPAGVGLAAGAAAQLEIAQAALTTAQTDERNARRALEDAQVELTRWQRHGQQAFDDAQAAAGRASSHLQTLSIVPPPLAGLPSFAPLSPTPPRGLGDPARPGGLILPAKKGKGGKGKGGKGKGEGEPDNGDRAKPHKPSGTGKSGYDRHTARRSGLANKRPEFRKRPKGYPGPWPPK